MPDPHDLYRLDGDPPDLGRPVLIQALSGFVDAGAAARLAREHLLSTLRSQVVATFGLAPLTLLFFQQVSLVGFVANLVAIPLVTLVVTPLALAGIVLPPLWGVAAWCIQGLTTLLQALAAWPGAVWSAAAAPGCMQAAARVGAALLGLRLPWPVRALALPLILPPSSPRRNMRIESDSFDSSCLVSSCMLSRAWALPRWVRPVPVIRQCAESG